MVAYKSGGTGGWLAGALRLSPGGRARPAHHIAGVEPWLAAQGSPYRVGAGCRGMGVVLVGRLRCVLAIRINFLNQPAQGHALHDDGEHHNNVGDGHEGVALRP